MNVFGWTVLGIVGIAAVVILIIDPFDWRENEAPALRAKIDSLLTENAEYKRQNEQLTVNWKNCEASKDTHTVKTITQMDSTAYWYVLSLLQGVKDSLAAAILAERLSPKKFFDPVGSIFDDDYFHVRVNVRGTTYPMTGKTDLLYSFSEYNRKKSEIVYVYRDRLVYVSSAYVYAQIGIGRNWTQRKYQLPFGVGLFADLSKTFSVDIQAVNATWIGSKVDVSTNGVLRIKF